MGRDGPYVELVQRAQHTAPTRLHQKPAAAGLVPVVPVPVPISGHH